MLFCCGIDVGGFFENNFWELWEGFCRVIGENWFIGRERKNFGIVF